MSDTPRVVRWADLLCDIHVDRIVRSGWVAGGGWPDLHVAGNVSCRGCYEAVTRELASGPIRPVVLPEIPDAEFRRGTACHEAAHAVLAERMGLDVLGSRIADTARAGGRTWFTHDEPISAERLDLFGVVGWAAEWQWVTQRLGKVDRAAAVDLAVTSLTDDVQLADPAGLPARREVATHAVTEHRAEINAVASALLRHGRLDGPSVRAALAEASPRSPKPTTVALDTPTSSATSASTTSPPVTEPGGGMSIEEVRATIADVAQQGQGAAEHCHQLTQVLAGMSTRLATVAQGSSSTELAEAIGQLQTARETAEQLPGTILAAADTAETYASQI